MSRRIAIHPFLFASFASLSLIANNLAETGGQGLQTWALSIAFAGGIYFLFWVFSRDGLRAGLCATGAVVLFFSYGHVQNQIASVIDAEALSPILIAAWAALLVGWVYWVMRKSGETTRLSGAMNVVGAALNVFPLYLILTYAWTPVGSADLASTYLTEDQETPRLVVPSDPPDIYYIVLDAYAREDVLKSIYDYDNSEFLEALRDRGFVIDPRATTNYTHSDISIASSLNLRHVADLPEFLRENGSADHEDSIRAVSATLIQESALRRLLESAGYEIIAFDSGFGHTQITDGDEYLSSPNIDDPGPVEIGLELMLLDTTIGREFIGLLGEEASPHSKLFNAHRERVLFTTSELPNIADRTGPKFVFAHIISPHVPFVFGPNGEEISGVDPYTLLDAEGGNEANIELYRNQLHYLNSLILPMIDALLARSGEPPIIVIQSDHGSKVYKNANPPADIELALNLPILRAIYAPQASDDAFYPGMTSVNTFRQILNVYFGADLELKPDFTYILSESNGTTAFVEVCEIYDPCDLPPDVREAGG